jgi:hypothetical protein
VFLSAVWIFLSILTRDRLFLVCLAVVGLGVILSVAALLFDRKAEKTVQAAPVQ